MHVNLNWIKHLVVLTFLVSTVATRAQQVFQLRK